MNAPRAGSKLHRMLCLFADGRQLNRFEAERLGDHVLPQSVQRLARDCGLLFARRDEVVPGFAGGHAHTTRYWLDPDQQARAKALLDGRDPAAAGERWISPEECAEILAELRP